nr:hypothetical protein [Tanacetum cinerariifolium]
MWDWWHKHMVCWGEVDGTVQVRGSIRERSVGVMGEKAGKVVGFTKLIVSNYMTTILKISKRALDKYHNSDDDMMVKNTFNSGKHKDGVGMKILSWMITDKMKLTKNYRLYTVMFGKICDELEVKQNVQKVKEHLIAEEIEKLVEGAENVENVDDDSSTLRQDDTQNIPGTMLEPKSNKESLKVEITAAEQPRNVIKEEEASVEDDYELRRREKGKHVKDSRSTPSPKTIRSPRTHSTLVSSDAKKLQELTSFFDELQGCYGYLFEHLKRRFMPRKKFNVLTQHLQEIMEDSLPQMELYVRSYFTCAPTQVTSASAQEKQYQLYLTMRENPQLQQEDLPIWLTLKYKFERLYVSYTPCKPSTVHPRDQDDPHDNAHLEGVIDEFRYEIFPGQD